MPKKSKPPFGHVRTAKKRVTDPKTKKVTVVEHTWDFQPKKLTKGLKRQIRRLLETNPAEADRQMALVGATRSQIEKKAKR